MDLISHRHQDTQPDGVSIATSLPPSESTRIGSRDSRALAFMASVQNDTHPWPGTSWGPPGSHRAGPSAPQRGQRRHVNGHCIYCILSAGESAGFVEHRWTRGSPAESTHLWQGRGSGKGWWEWPRALTAQPGRCLLGEPAVVLAGLRVRSRSDALNLYAGKRPGSFRAIPALADVGVLRANGPMSVLPCPGPQAPAVERVDPLLVVGRKHGDWGSQLEGVHED